MDKKIGIFLLLGILIVIGVSLVNLYMAGVAAILVAALLMSLLIMQDTRDTPELAATIREDARAILITNKGNARAVRVHAVLAPLNIEREIPVIGEDAVYEIPLDTPLTGELKAVITYENEYGRRYGGTTRLSVFGEEPDLLRPMIPVFSWKK